MNPSSPDTADYESLRRWMVDSQLRRRGIHDPRVLAAMEEVPRELFVPEGQQAAAYEDRALPLSHGQTVSQPFTVAFMCEALELQGTEKVLEVGTGSGYAAAVLSRIVPKVHTIERIEALAIQARERLAVLGYDNVAVHVGDGTLGLPDEAPFDGIVVTAGGLELPPPLAAQLAPGGRIVIPLQHGGGQVMRRFTRGPDGVVDENLGAFAFVPLIGMFGWTDD